MGPERGASRGQIWYTHRSRATCSILAIEMILILATVLETGKGTAGFWFKEEAGNREKEAAGRRPGQATVERGGRKWGNQPVSD
jgi:hypothetical protein